MGPSPARSNPWAEEIRHFDAVARTKDVLPLDQEIVARYRNPYGPWPIDFMYRLAGDLRGKRVLDVGAGCGENALVMAALGADVVAVDISSESLDVLDRRATISGLQNRIRSVCSPIEHYNFDQMYDLVWCEAFLHHVLANLPLVLHCLSQAAGARFIMSEPFSPKWLRKVRLAVPIATYGTPGERPLLPSELELIAEHFPGLRFRHFNALSRVIRFVSEPKARMLAYLDRPLLSIPFLRPFGSIVVMWT